MRAVHQRHPPRHPEVGRDREDRQRWPPARDARNVVPLDVK